ncbi:uncharacterized protein isoform X2 [Choristoneura fumiferana]
MTPHSLNLSKSPTPPKRRVLGLLQSPFEETVSLNNIENLPQYTEELRPTERKSPYQPFKCDSYNTPTRKSLGVFKSPIPTSSRKVLGEIQNSPSPVAKRILGQSPFKFERIQSPVTSQRSFRRISKVFEDRNKFKMANKENIEKFEEEARDAEFQYGREEWTATKLDFTDVLQSTHKMEDHTFKQDTFVPEKEEIDPEFDTLHDLEEEFDNDNFDQCSKYEIISTDSPDIISRGRNSSSRKITSRNFIFGAPLADTEQSTSFNRPARALNFEDSMFEFTSPAIKKTNSGSVKKSLKFNETPTKDSSPPLKRIFTSESTTSMESGFVSEFDEQFLDMEESNSPKVAHFEDLLSGQIKNNIIANKQSLYRSKSFNPGPSKARVSLLSILESPQQEKRSQKRADTSESELENKRRKCEDDRVRPVLQRAFSENNASIMSALDRSAVNPDLIGDFSQPFALPLTSGNHSDLKSISCDTLATLLRGGFEDSVEDFQVIDCRYPYEFEGGHIAGAQNLYTPAQVMALVSGPKPSNKQRRSILVFHCEFSLERGPKLSRFLRSSDREKNKENYPSLHFPEVYLLHEGYRAFFQRHPDLCSPAGYTAMLDPKHRDSLKRHRSVQQPSSSTHHRRNRLLF